VRIVAAGVHDANVLTVDLRTHPRSEGKIRLLRHGQRIHVSTKCNDWPWATAAQETDDTMSTNTGSHLHPKTAQMGGDHLGRARLLEGELRVLMNVATPSDNLWIDGSRVPRDLLGERLSACRRWRAEGGNQRCRDCQYDETRHACTPGGSVETGA
jgi:hypothetical protein